MFRRQIDPRPSRRRLMPLFGTPLDRTRARLSYANVVASLALFVALGGTAAAAITLPSDSVGPQQIRKGAVRSPEIAKDAVRSLEISDSTIRLADISSGARDALEGAPGPVGPAGPTGPQGPAGTANVRIAEKDFAVVESCPGEDLRECDDLIQLSLGSPAADAARDWLVQAKLVLSSPDGTGDDFGNRCGIVQAVNQAPTAITDDVRVGSLHTSGSGAEVVALSGVVTKRARNPVMALRCNEPQFDELEVEDMTITAIEVGTLTGP